jgi:hypothetical protein
MALDRCLPFPLGFTTQDLLDLLSLGTNPKLRRELGKYLEQTAGPRWPSPLHTDPAWGEALAALLSSHEGYQIFMKAAEQHNRGPLEEDHRLNLLRRGMNRIVHAKRKAGLPKSGGSWSATVLDLLHAGQADDAAFMAWFVSLVASDGEIALAMSGEPRLAALFGLEPAVPQADSLDEIRRLAAVVAVAEELDAGTLETLSRLAGDAAMRIRAEQEQGTARLSTLLARVEQSPLAIGVVKIPEGASADEIENALDEAEASAVELAEKDVELQAATGRRDYKYAARLAVEAETAQEAATIARAALLTLLEDKAPASTHGRRLAASGAGAGDTLLELAEADGVKPASAENAAEATRALPDAAPETSDRDTEPDFEHSDTAGREAEDFAAERTVTAAPVPPKRFEEEGGVGASSVDAGLSHAAPSPVPVMPFAGHETLAAGAWDALVGVTAETSDNECTIEKGSREAAGHPAPDTAFWAALQGGRLGLAKAMLEVGALPGDQVALRLALHLAALALVADGSGEVDDRVSEETEALVRAWPEQTPGRNASAAVWLLALPAAGLLTILAPGGNASHLVDFILEQPMFLPHMHALARTLSESGVALGGLWRSSEALASLASEDERRLALDTHCGRVRGWLDRNRDAPLNNYAPAKILWSRMLADGGLLGSMLAVVVHNEVRRAPDVAASLAGFSGQDELRRLDIEIRGLKLVHKTPISFGAERDLNDLMDEVQLLIRDWTRLAAWTTNRRSGAGVAEVKRLREDLLDLLTKAQEEVASLPESPAAPVVLRLLLRFGALLRTGTTPREAASVDQLLASDVLSVPRVTLDPAWRMHVPRDTATLEALVGAARETVPVEEAIARRVAAREFAGAVLALTLVEDADRRASLDREIRNAAGIALSETILELTRLRSDAEAAETAGRLPSEQAQPFLREIEELEERLNQASPEDIPDLVQVFKLLELNLCETLSDSERLMRERIMARVLGLGLARAAAIRPPVERALARGWLAIAEDLVDRVEAGEPVDEPVEAPSAAADFERFFPVRSDSVSRWLKTNKAGIGSFIAQPDSLPADILSSNGIAPPERSLPLAKAWAACGRPGDREFARAIATLFGELGFADPKPEGLPPLTATSADARFTLRTAPLRDRETTLLPEFGSAANGSYTVLCLWRQPEVSLIRTALQKSGGRAERVVVLFFGVMTNTERRELAKMARNGQITSVLVLDQVLALHLALTEQNRLRTFFVCTLPFSGVKPWSETGAPPPEMFFGRQSERRSIEATSGQLSHLVYGGRQLGKTALLRQIEGGAAGDPQRVVRYVDIKRFGNTVATEELWATLAEALRPDVPINLDGKGDVAARFRKYVRDWLRARPDRSILLLLDEADKFFKEDQTKRYRITEELRSLSEETQRSFKPVFAGLENVQRMARDPNNPFAQLATPLLIGPLLRGAERREAEALVRWPFTALGFTLAPEAVNRILIFANYYPSLIQLVCQNLLHALRSKGGGGPPWRVELSDVEVLLGAPDLRRAAFEKFRITLELDQRYFLLALVVAELSRADTGMLAAGIPVRELHDYASISWPAGFPPELGEAAFDALADQMVGLGLFRSLAGQRYALRSANLVHLIGSPKSITEQLNAFRDRPAPPEPDPLEDRRTIDGAPSVLTTRQEAEIVGAAPGDRIVVCLGIALGGCGIDGVPRLEKAIREAVKSGQNRRDVRIETPSLKARTLDAFRAEIEAASAPRKETNRRLLVVSPGHGWTPEWVTVAHQTISRRPAGSVPLRVAFLADARISWNWAKDGERRDNLLSGVPGGSPQVVEVVPGLWNRPSLDVWLELHDQTVTLPDWLVNDREVLLRGTGGWDWALQRVFAAGRQGFAKTDANGLARQLLERDKTGDDPLVDLRALPEAIRLLAAVDEAVGFAMPPPGLAWALAVEAVVPGSQGLQLNALLRMALPMLTASRQ